MMAFAMLKIKDNNLQLVNAGMPPVYVYRKSNGIVEEIELNGMPLGAMLNSKFVVNQFELKAEDTVLMVSDGLPELQNRDEELFGYERVANEFFNVAEQSPEKIIEGLRNAGDAWANNGAPDDDITFVVIKAK